MKTRRELKVGEKVRFEDGDGVICAGVINGQLSKEIYGVSMTTRAVVIHRRQVISVFKKREKPLIISVHKSYLDHAKEDTGIIARVGHDGSATDEIQWTPFRPLTRKERERWGV